jgi:hypothetical protein
MLGLYGGDDLDVIFNIIIFISKWEIEGHLKKK